MQYEIKARKGKAILMKTSIESIKRFYWYVPMAQSGIYDCGVLDKRKQLIFNKIEHVETVTIIRENIENHLAYIHLYMFLVAGVKDVIC